MASNFSFSHSEKLLVTSNFSFSHSVFKRLVSQGRQKVSFCGNGLTSCAAAFSFAAAPPSDVVDKYYDGYDDYGGAKEVQMPHCIIPII